MTGTATPDPPFVRDPDTGASYLCGRCSAQLPDGVQVLGHWTPTGKLTGVKALDGDGNVQHECGSKVADGEGGY